jgi:hypothetical protein
MPLNRIQSLFDRHHIDTAMVARFVREHGRDLALRRPDLEVHLRPVDDGPHNDAWMELLPPCFRGIDEVVRERKVEFSMRIGDGSMLLRRYRHSKESRPLPLVTDAQLVRWCSPCFNETAAGLFPGYGEEQRQ